jgi:hypothetical protein
MHGEGSKHQADGSVLSGTFVDGFLSGWGNKVSQEQVKLRGLVGSVE